MPREVVLSKALSHLLRHSADRENLKISKEGYVNVADLVRFFLFFAYLHLTNQNIQLEARKIKPLKATLAEILESVSSSDKQRFSLLYIPATNTETGSDKTKTQQEEEEEERKEEKLAFATAASEEKQKTATAHALAVKDGDASHFLIRATQGHSMKCVDTTLFLEKLTLDGDVENSNDKSATAASLPDTVVHGTYHGAWPLILASGGLQAMNRAQVHFAIGPTIDEIFPNGRDAPPAKLPATKQNQNVISGMRSDAEILIYVNLRKALQAGCPFYRSENGVILSEGMVSGDADQTAGKFVPVEFFDLVVERKAGLGVLWEDGNVVQELPENLAAKKNPKSFRGGRGGRGRGRGCHS
jgi:2'-phosphotransferase